MTAYNPFLESVPLSIPDSLFSNRPVMDGEPVNAAVTNRLPRANAENTAVIHALIKQFRNLSGEYLWRMPISADVVIGDFVYFDAHSRVFKKGLARFELAGDSIVESDTSLVWGVVIDIKDGRADICTNGLCEFRVSGDVYTSLGQPGPRFLSAIVPGRVSEESKSPHKCVGFLVGAKPTGEVQFFVRSYLSVDPRMHQHKSYALAASPAGDWRSEAGITNANVNLPGWLPASHPIFGGKNPIGAVYGYNPHFLPDCGWPIQCPSQASLRWQRTRRVQVPLLAAVPPEFYHIDDTSIWWRVFDNYPWDATVSFAAGQPVDVPEDLLESEYEQKMWLDVLDVGYAVSDARVTTLRTGTSKGVYVRQFPYGGPAISGDLEVGLDLRLTEKAVPEGVGYAIGGIGHNVQTETGEVEDNVLLKVPVVSRFRVNSRVLRVHSQYQDAEGFCHGSVTLSDPTGVVGAEVPISATHLNGVEETLIRDSVGLAFSPAYPTSLLTQMTVPYDDLFRTMMLSVRLGILSILHGSVPNSILKLSYRIIKNPQGPNKAVSAFPQTDMVALPCDFSVSENSTTYGYYFVESEAVEVSPGDIFILKIERRPPDGYNERFILLRKTGVLGFLEASAG